MILVCIVDIFTKSLTTTSCSNAEKILFYSSLKCSSMKRNKKWITSSLTRMRRYASCIQSKTRYTLVHIYAKIMAGIRKSNLKIKSPVQYLGFLPDFFLLISLGIGMYAHWAYTKDNAISVIALLSAFVFCLSFALQYYFDQDQLGLSVFHLWVGCLMGILTFISQAELQYIVPIQVMEAMFLFSTAISWIWNILERIFKWGEIKTSLLTLSEGFECVGFIISSIYTGHDGLALALFTFALMFHLSSLRVKSGLGFISFVGYIFVGIFLFFPSLNVKVNVITLTCFLGRQAFQPLVDLYFCGSSTTDRWRIYFNKSRFIRYSCLLILCVLEFVTIGVVGHQSTKHKEWFIVFPIFMALGVVWLCFHLLYFHTCWRLLGKVTECNVNAHLDGTSFNRIMAAKGLRYFALLSQGIILVSLVTTVLVFVVSFETRTPYTLALIFLVLPVEAASLSLFWYLGNSLGGICSGYGVITPVTSMKPGKGAKLLTMSDVESIGHRATTTLNFLQQFFAYHMVQNFGCDYSTSGMDEENLKKKLSSFFESTTQDGPRFDTYLLYYSGDVYDNGDWALADGHRLALTTLLEWWTEKSAGSGTRLLLVLDCVHSYKWASSLARKTSGFVAIQTCRYLNQNQPDPETASTCSVGDFTRAFMQFNTGQEVSLDWVSPSRPLRAMYKTSNRWTDFTFHFPTSQEIENYWSSNFPHSLRVLIKLLALSSFSSSLCCFRCVSRWLRYLQMLCLPPKQLDTGHGFHLINS